MKRILFIFIAVLLISALFACGQDSDIKNNEEPEEVYDFQQQTFTYAYHIPSGIYRNGDSSIEDAQVVRYKELEETFNIKFVFKKELIPMTKIAEQIAIGSAEYDLIGSSGQSIRYEYPYLLPLNDIGTIDISEYKWGSDGLKELFTVDNKLYAFNPMYWSGFLPYPYYPIIFNDSLVKYFNLQDPREYYEKMNWTWDIFEDLVKNSYEKSKDGKNIYSLTMNRDAFLEILVMSNSGKIVDYADDNYSFALNSPNAVEALEWGVGFVERNAENIKLNPHNNNLFAKGNFTFACEPSWYFVIQEKDFPSMEIENYGWLPFPLGPKREQGDWAAISRGADPLCIPYISVMNPDEIGVIINKMFEPLESYTYDNVYKDIERSVFYNPKDFALYDYFIKNMVYDYTIEFDKDANKVENSIFDKMAPNILNKKQSVTEYLESIKEKSQQSIDKYLNGES